jgi:ABC-type glutathione transport system ATPase component
VLIIAHRLSTVRHANEIIVMDGGRIAERGSHDQLLALQDQGGIYAKLWNLQLKSRAIALGEVEANGEEEKIDMDGSERKDADLSTSTADILNLEGLESPGASASASLSASVKSDGAFQSSAPREAATAPVADTFTKVRNSTSTVAANGPKGRPAAVSQVPVPMPIVDGVGSAQGRVVANLVSVNAQNERKL